MKADAEWRRYRAAALAEAGVTPAVLARLTDRQIALIYRHPRDKHGTLIMPMLAQATPLAPPGLSGPERRRAILARLESDGAVTQSSVEAARAALEEQESTRHGS